MFARVTVTRSSPERVNEMSRHIREQIIPKAKSLAGFKTGYWLINRKTGNGLTVTFWESEEAERASQSDAAKVREQAQKALGLQVVSVEAYEVIGQA